jgi:hypothetical protein
MVVDLATLDSFRGDGEFRQRVNRYEAESERCWSAREFSIAPARSSPGKGGRPSLSHSEPPAPAPPSAEQYGQPPY